MLFLSVVVDELLVNFPELSTNSTLLPRKMSQFFGSTNTPARRRCAARINGIPCGEVCQSPLSLFCNEHIPGFVTLPQQTYGRCTYFNSDGRICQNAIVSPNTPFCTEHRPTFMAPMMPSCTYNENGLRCANVAAVVPTNYGHSFIGVPWPLCEAHALPHIYNHFGVVPPPPQIQQIARRVLESNNKPIHVYDVCSVCTEDIVVSDYSCSLHCKHTYHGKCLKQWFDARRRDGSSPNCPNCRAAVTERDERNVSLAVLNQAEDEQYDDNGVFINNGPANFNYVPNNIPNGDVFFRGHVFHVQGDSDEEDHYDGYEDDGFDYLAPRNLMPEFDQAVDANLLNVSSSSSASSIAQQMFDEVVQ